MDFNIINIFLHIDKYLAEIISYFGIWTYILLFLIIFIETGLVIMPFLPGDSLLFAIGAFSAIGSINLPAILLILIFAAIIGDSVNYWIGNKIGEKLFTKENSRIFNKNYLIKAQKFYDKYGAKTIVLARFIPIIRTFAPFVAGMGKMKYKKFLLYNIFGGIAWVSLFIFAGYFFGNIPFVEKNFSIVILAIIIISIIPVIIQAWIERRKKKK